MTQQRSPDDPDHSTRNRTAGTSSRRQALLAAASLTLGIPALAALAACSKTAATSAQTLAKSATVLCLGDSLTFGYGAGAGGSYPEQLEQLTGYVCQNAGVNGNTAQDALARLPGLLQNNQPGLVLVSVGGNDFLRRMPLTETRAALTAILRQAAASAQVVLLAQPQPVLLAAATGSLKDHPVYAELANDTGVALYAGGWSKVLSRPEWRSDEIHANSEGYRVFANDLADWLREKKFLA